MFTVLDRALFRPVDFPHLDELVFIQGAATPPGGDQLTWWSQARALAGLATYSAGGANLSTLGQSERIRVAAVSPSFFRVAEVPPAFGRTFVADHIPGLESEAVVSHAFAVAHFGAPTSAIGQGVALNSVGYRVIGVMPPSFGFPARTEIWIPRPPHPASVGAFEGDLDLASFGQTLVGRLRQGVSLDEARAELKVMSRRLEETNKKSGVALGLGAVAIPLKRALSRESRPALLALSAAVLLVLLLTSVNAANLILAHAVEREKELAIYIWLGASRARLFRQLLTESLLLALGAGVLGVLIAILGIDLFRAYAPQEIPGLLQAGIDIRAVGFASALSLITAVAAGLAPALRTYVRDIAQALKEHGERTTGPIRQRARQALVVAEVVLALVLTTGAGLMVESLRELIHTEPGFEPRSALTAELALPRARYAPPGPTAHPDSTNARIEAFQRSLFENIGRLPGVTAVGVVSDLPLTDMDAGSLAFDVRGIPQPETAITFSVGGDYFHAMSIPLRSGRYFDESDPLASSRVVMINEALAQRCWAGKNPVGDSLLLEGEPAARRVIGVVGDVKYGGLGEPPAQQIYLPWFQPFSPKGGASVANLKMDLVLRVASGSETLAALIREEVASLDPEVPLFSVRPLEEIVSSSAGPLRLRAVTLSLFATLALVLAAAGVYSVVSYSVARRTHEIGVRMSLGARRQDVLLQVIGEGARLGLVGVGLGTVASLEAGKLISGLLFGTAPNDPATLGAACLTLFLLTLIASAVPAFRAASVDPSISIRYE